MNSSNKLTREEMARRRVERENYIRETYYASYGDYLNAYYEREENKTTDLRYRNPPQARERKSSHQRKGHLLRTSPNSSKIIKAKTTPEQEISIPEKAATGLAQRGKPSYPARFMKEAILHILTKAFGLVTTEGPETTWIVTTNEKEGNLWPFPQMSNDKDASYRGESSKEEEYEALRPPPHPNPNAGLENDELQPPPEPDPRQEVKGARHWQNLFDVTPRPPPTPNFIDSHHWKHLMDITLRTPPNPNYTEQRQ